MQLAGGGGMDSYPGAQLTPRPQKDTPVRQQPLISCPTPTPRGQLIPQESPLPGVCLVCHQDTNAPSSISPLRLSRSDSLPATSEQKRAGGENQQIFIKTLSCIQVLGILQWLAQGSAHSQCSMYAQHG